MMDKSSVTKCKHFRRFCIAKCVTREIKETTFYNFESQSLQCRRTHNLSRTWTTIGQRQRESRVLRTIRWKHPRVYVFTVRIYIYIYIFRSSLAVGTNDDSAAATSNFRLARITSEIYTRRVEELN